MKWYQVACIYSLWVLPLTEKSDALINKEKKLLVCKQSYWSKPKGLSSKLPVLIL